MRISSRLASLELEQILPSGDTRAVTLGSFWDPARKSEGVPTPAPRAVVLVFLRHFG